MTEPSDNQAISGEDPEVVAEAQDATVRLRNLLESLDLHVEYVEADWKDTESLIKESFDVMKKLPGWSAHYLNGDSLGIDSQYIFFLSKQVPDSELLVQRIAELIVGEGADLPAVIEHVYDCQGNHRIRIGSVEGQPSSYNNVATLVHRGQIFAAFIPYYEGGLDHDMCQGVYRLEQLGTDARLVSHYNMFMPKEPCPHITHGNQCQVPVICPQMPQGDPE